MSLSSAHNVLLSQLLNQQYNVLLMVHGLGHSPEEIAEILRQQSIDGSLMLQRHMDEVAVFDEKLRQLSTLPRYQPELHSLTRPEVRRF